MGTSVDKSQESKDSEFQKVVRYFLGNEKPKDEPKAARSLAKRDKKSARSEPRDAHRSGRVT